MTTEAAAQLYLAQHIYEMQRKGWAIYNPNNIVLSELPIIYGFNNGGSPGSYSAVLLAEDGTVLGGHLCSAEEYMPHDLGILEGTRPDRHKSFRKHYPNGYRMVFIPLNKVKEHRDFMLACEKNQQIAKKAEKHNDEST